MNKKQKKIGIVFTILIFSHSMLLGDISTITAPYTTFIDKPIILEKSTELTINQMIAPLLPPIDKELIKDVDKAIKEYVQFMKSA